MSLPRPTLHFAARLAIALTTLAAALPGPAIAHDEHSGHRAAAALVRSEHAYRLPTVQVTRSDGRRMALAEAIDDGRPVMLNFVYTSCNAICPVTSQVFVEVRERLGAERAGLNMISISIDPEQDTPRRLQAYADRFGSAGTWTHLTSSVADAIEIQRAFDAWRGDKMNHQATTYLRAAPGQPWVRLDGFFGPSAIVGEFRRSKVAASAGDSCRAEVASGTVSLSAAGARAGTNIKCKS